MEIESGGFCLPPGMKPLSKKELMAKVKAQNERLIYENKLRQEAAKKQGLGNNRGGFGQAR